LFGQFPELAHLLATDIEAAYHNDPAASSVEEILLAYHTSSPSPCSALPPSVSSRCAVHPRMMTEIAHSHTGIDIHPGASIGESFLSTMVRACNCETSIIGNKVTLYHGVTLGAFNPLSKDARAIAARQENNGTRPSRPRHRVSNATILGGNTHSAITV